MTLPHIELASERGRMPLHYCGGKRESMKLLIMQSHNDRYTNLIYFSVSDYWPINSKIYLKRYSHLLIFIIYLHIYYVVVKYCSRGAHRGLHELHWDGNYVLILNVRTVTGINKKIFLKLSP